MPIELSADRLLLTSEPDDVAPVSVELCVPPDYRGPDLMLRVKLAPGDPGIALFPEDQVALYNFLAHHLGVRELIGDPSEDEPSFGRFHSKDEVRTFAEAYKEWLAHANLKDPYESSSLPDYVRPEGYEPKAPRFPVVIEVDNVPFEGVSLSDEKPGAPAHVMTISIDVVKAPVMVVEVALP